MQITSFTDLKVWQRAMDVAVDNIALGSEGELFTQLELGCRLGFATRNRLTPLFDDLCEVGRMMRGLVKSLEASR